MSASSTPGRACGGADGCTGQIVVRADSAYYNSAVVGAVIKAGATYRDQNHVLKSRIPA